MSDKALINVVRVLRIICAVCLIVNVAVALAAAGIAQAFVNAGAAVFLALMIGFQTFVLRRQRMLDRPRPDYSAIAAMEREVYGETFDHDGSRPSPNFAPNRATGKIPPDTKAKAAKPRKPTFEDDRRAMRALGEARRTEAARRGERGMKHLAGMLDNTKAVCEQGHGDQLWVQDHGQMCPQCERQRDGYEHRSNLRWERPS
jgi:hypothetical protein